MDIQPIFNPLVKIASKAFEVGKKGILSGIYVVQAGYSRYAMPAAEKLSSLANVFFNLLQRLFQAGPGFIFALAGGLMIAGVTAFKLADRKAYEDDMLIKTVWKTAGVIAFISATALTSVGMYAVLTL